MATAAKRKPTTKSTGTKKPLPASDVRPGEIPIAWIDPSPSNPRTEFDDGELAHLAGSIKEHGLLQPVVVRKVGTRYQLIAGDRRLRAAKRAGKKAIAAVVRDVSDDDALMLGLVENIEREDLNPVDMARAVARLCAPESEGGCAMSQVDAGEQLSRDASWVRRQLQLVKLPDVWLKRIAAGELNAGMGQVLVPYADRPAVLARIEDDMLANPWAWRTVDDFERNAKLLAEGTVTTKKPATPSELKPRRSSPSDGERMQTQQDVATPDAAVSVAGDVERSTAAAVHTADDATAVDAPRAVSVDPPRATAGVDNIIAAIRQLDSIEELDKIIGAAEGRRRALIEVK